MLVFGVLAFAMATFFLSFLIGVRGESDKGKVAAFTVLVAWGSMLAGLLLAKAGQ